MKLSAKLILTGLLLAGLAGLAAEPVVTVSPVVTTGATGKKSLIGNADDPAVWIHPDDPARSVVIGSDKDEGLWVWDLEGRELQHMPLKTPVNNVDLRCGFRLGGDLVDIVAANLRTAGKLAVFKLNPDYTGSDILIPLAGKDSSNNDLQKNSYAFALYKRPSDGSMYVFERPKKRGILRQYLLEDDGTGSGIKVTPVRDLSYQGGTAEGTVADDELGFVYIAEEEKGIHKYHADPDKSNAALALFATGDGITLDREGLALFKGADGNGYLILSSQGDAGRKIPAQLKIYERQGNNRFVKTVNLQDHRGRGDQMETDGVDAAAASLPPGFPHGFVIAHDSRHSAFQIYRWEDIAESDLESCGGGLP